ncbi:class III lanthionine synthetase LanKC [Rubrivirga sp. IMCC45206]|uniref:class III lanthionine synthetase LanKC n=1 Tax=Rubrivirga sp. IMCC45206 TaxID=3391614 RepID=UPI00398FB03C
MHLDHALPYTLMSPEHFESLDRYVPSPDWGARVRSVLGPKWSVQEGGFWTRATPPAYAPIAQGWKIHVSATPASAPVTLERVLPVLLDEATAFKYVADPRMARLSTSKNWSRVSAGKFLVAYPDSEAAFVRLAERLADATRDLAGPYILSDKPLGDSRAVFYRYGAHTGVATLGPTGSLEHQLRTPDGLLVPDPRGAVYRAPAWASDPFGGGAAEERRGPIVLHGRYEVRSAIRYAGSGGLYRARDSQTGTDVVIREARPFMSPRSGSDARDLLNKEARVLDAMAPTGLVPALIDVFDEWEHRFLVQEAVSGPSLWFHAAEWYFRDREPLSDADLYGRLVDTFRQVAEGVGAFHEQGILLRDLTRSNLLVPESGGIRFIDFELAHEVGGSDPVVSGGTPGYRSPAQRRGDRPTEADDHYALGALLLDLVSFNVAGSELNPDGTLRVFDLAARDVGFPDALGRTVRGLMHPSPAERWSIARAVDALEAARGEPSSTVPAIFEGARVRPCPAPEPSLRAALPALLDGVVAYVTAHTDTDREDRVWPSCPEAFTTNGVGLRHGAAGVAAFLRRATGAVPEGVDAWIRASAHRRALPPGLMAGHAGLALYWLEAGDLDAAQAALRDASAGERLALSTPGLYDGAAGWGLAHLSVWAQAPASAALAAARRAGDHLVSAARPSSAGVYWDQEGTVRFGLGHGQAGVSLFLTYLARATGDPAYLDVAVAAMDDELSRAVEFDSLTLWRFYTREGGVGVGSQVPHTEYGSAGVGTALVRLFAATGEPRFLEMAERCAHVATHRQTDKLWLDHGLAGFGEFLVDMAEYTGDEGYRHHAFAVAEGLLAARADRPAGAAFPGRGLARLSCGLGSGSAGVGLFLHRLLTPGAPRFLYPDALLAADPVAVPSGPGALALT